MKTAFLYAGQGSQCTGMGKDLYEKNDFVRSSIDRADELLPELSLKATMFEGPEDKLSETHITQPALAAFAVGVTESLFDAGIRPDYVAGQSLGEYSALFAVGVFDKDTLFKTTAFRGCEMEKAAAGIAFRMTAVLGLEEKEVRAICDQIKKEDQSAMVEISNLNGKGQVVIAGNEADVMKAEEAASAAGAKKCIALKVGGPFHTSRMKPAGKALESYFENISFGQMQIPVLFNVTGKELSADEDIKSLLIRQVSETVRLTDILTSLEEKGVTKVVEIGPGKTIAGMIRRSCSGIKTVSISNADDLAAAVDMILQEDQTNEA